MDGAGWKWMELGGCGWSWVEVDGAGWSGCGWVELDEAGLRWVHCLVIPLNMVHMDLSISYFGWFKDSPKYIIDSPI